MVGQLFIVFYFYFSVIGENDREGKVRGVEGREGKEIEREKGGREGKVKEKERERESKRRGREKGKR